MDSANQHSFIQVDTPKTSAKDYYEREQMPQLTLQWADLTLRVDVKNTETKKTEQKTILNEVSGSARPGELLVIMGPSGAGKSSMLDCISGHNRDIEGSITVNGQPWTKQMKRLTAYVMQEDLFYETITVYEHLVFQARLRMGKTFTEEQYLHRVNQVMEQLGLKKSRDTLIGGTRVRGISGGERKRLSFATEILTNPSILFVDEPTSGLDSFMAEAVITQLRKIAREGRTVIATIHQPSSELFALFDKLYLLSDGATVYHGPASDSVAYFGSLGYQCPAFINPSDFFMRQLVVMDKATDVEGVARLERFKREWRTHRETKRLTQSQSSEIVLMDSEIETESSRLSALGQIAVLTNRNVARLLRDGFSFQVVILQSIFISLVVGLIYLQLDITQTGIQNLSGGLFFIIVQEAFAAGNPTFIAVPLELPIISREYKSGLFHLMSWYLAKNVSELPTQILLPVVAFVPVYLLMGIGHGFSVFLNMQIIMILLHSACVGLGYMVSCLARRVELAPIIGVVVLLPFTLFGGLLINSDNTPDYFVWVEYISPLKFAFEGLMKIYWNQVAEIPCDAAVESCLATTGTQVLQYYSMQNRSAFVDGVILVALNLGFRLVGFLGLWRHLRSSK